MVNSGALSLCGCGILFVYLVLNCFARGRVLVCLDLLWYLVVLIIVVAGYCGFTVDWFGCYLVCLLGLA